MDSTTHRPRSSVSCRAAISASCWSDSAKIRPGRARMTSSREHSYSGDDSLLPDDERALLHRARALIPRLAERVPAATAARRLPEETIAEYRAIGILRILQPA